MKHVGALQPANDSDELSAMEQSVDPVLLASVKAMLARGWALTPVRAKGEEYRFKGENHVGKGKEAYGDDWPSRRLSYGEILAELAGHRGRNVGIIWGGLSGRIIDVDIDLGKHCGNRRLLDLADQVLPQTTSVFGRASWQRSHRQYHVPDLRTGDNSGIPAKLVTPSGIELGEVLRNRQQSVAPGSIHGLSSERIEWADGAGEPATISAADLIAAIERYCDAADALLEQIPSDEAQVLLAEAKPRRPRADSKRQKLHRSGLSCVTGEGTLPNCVTGSFPLPDCVTTDQAPQGDIDRDVVEAVATALLGQVTAQELAQAIVETQPSQSGTRNFTVFDFVRYLKLDLDVNIPDDDLELLRPLADEWHRIARGRGMTTSPPSDTWSGFRRGWPVAKFPFNGDLALRFWRDKLNEYGPDSDRWDWKARLVRFLADFQQYRGEGRDFSLSVSQATAVAWSSYADGIPTEPLLPPKQRTKEWASRRALVNRYMNELHHEGVRLKCVMRAKKWSKADGRKSKASEWRWLG